MENGLHSDPSVKECAALTSDALQQLRKYIEAENYKGYDPYDGLTSPLFNLPLINEFHTFRFLAQQLIKRLPFNIRPFLGIKKSLNPVTLGLSLYAYSVTDDDNSRQSAYILEQLKILRSKGFSGACWGYNFSWAARYASIPAYQPTVVATGIINNGLYQYYLKTQSAEAAELIISACTFVEKDLKRFNAENGTICFSYSPFDTERVYNASMKAARILSQGYALTKNEVYRTLAEKAVAYVISKQENNGSWKYSESRAGVWTDNYHTGYILDCFSDYMKLTGDVTNAGAYTKGYDYYRNTFFTGDGQPGFYAGKLWPADCTAAAQSLLTLTNNKDYSMACRTAQWMICNMQSSSGGFYFRHYGKRIDKTSYMRWSDAWMFAGLSALQASLNKQAA